jgi:hypothetical protein
LNDDDAAARAVGELQGVLDLEEFQGRLMVALQRMLPSDFVSLNGLGPAAGVERFRRTQDGRATGSRTSSRLGSSRTRAGRGQ